MTITFLTNHPVDAAAVVDLFRSSGIRRPVDDPDRIQRMLNGANLTITAWDGDLLVGIGRALTDFSYCCYLSDLAVAGPYQHQGIGLKIVEQMRRLLGHEVMLLLLAAPEAMGYYPKIGFDKVENAWIIHRTR